MKTCFGLLWGKREKAADKRAIISSDQPGEDKTLAFCINHVDEITARDRPLHPGNASPYARHVVLRRRVQHSTKTIPRHPCLLGSWNKNTFWILSPLCPLQTFGAISQARPPNPVPLGVLGLE